MESKEGSTMTQIMKADGTMVNPFKAVGFCKIAESGKSLRVEINDHTDFVFTVVYYVGREASRTLASNMMYFEYFPTVLTSHH